MAEALFFIGLGCCVGFVAFWWVKNRQEHREAPHAVTDLLNYHYVEQKTEGVIRLKDGGLLAMYEYRGPDLTHQTKEMQDHLSFVMFRFLSRYENGWAFYFCGQRARLDDYPTGGNYTDPVNDCLDQQRRERFSAGASYYTNRYIFSVVWHPEGWAKTDRFHTHLVEMEEELADILKLQRLSADSALSELYYGLNGIRQKVHSPEQSLLIDSLLGNQEIFRIPGQDESVSTFSEFVEIPNYYQLRVGDIFVGAVTITGIPFYTSAGMFDLFNQLDIEYRYSTRIITMDRAEQEKKIDNIREMYRWGRKRPAELIGSEQEGDVRVKQAYENTHVLNMMEEAGEALGVIHGDQDRFAQVTTTFIVYSDSIGSLQEDLQRIMAKVRKAGCTAAVEKLQPLRALIGTLPGHSENIRRTFLSCRNIADMIPTWGVWTGNQTNSSVYMKGAPAHWIGVSHKGHPFIKQQPVTGDVGHKLILGPTGSGKSTYINFEISQWLRMKGAQVYLFDKGHSGEVLCKASGGAHYDIGGANGLRFQPLKHLDGGEVWYFDWLEMMIGLQGVTPTTAQKREIRNAIQSMKGIPPERRTLSEFVIQIQDRQLRHALEIYTRRGKYDILDAESDPIEENPYQVFEMEKILDMSDQILLPVLDYLFFRVEQSLSKDRPTLIYIEEAWKAFRKKQFSDRLEQWLRELRKKNAHVGLITQSPQDILRFENPTLFQDSCPEKVFLANPNAGASHYREIYSLFNLNESQVQLIKEAMPKRQYYIHTPSGSSLVDLRLDDLSLGFLGDRTGLNTRERTQTIQRLKLEYSTSWPAEWLRMQGLPSEADRLQQTINHYHQADE
ncbi:MAG: hypothetical protein JJU37_12885 [Balneolaceae bacterium]|nr:hypothetical protein [Balneolaceae bacterium]